MIETIQEELGEAIEKDEIDRSHRLVATKNNGKTRPVIIKIARYNTRCGIFKNNIK